MSNFKTDDVVRVIKPNNLSYNTNVTCWITGCEDVWNELMDAFDGITATLTTTTSHGTWRVEHDGEMWCFLEDWLELIYRPGAESNEPVVFEDAAAAYKRAMGIIE